MKVEKKMVYVKTLKSATSEHEFCLFLSMIMNSVHVAALVTIMYF